MRVRSFPLRAFLPHICARRCTQYLIFRSYASMHGHEIDSALGCNVYISEGRDNQVIQHLQAEAAATSGVALANVFVDAPYNRTGFTFVSTQADRLTAAVVRLSRAALQLLDLRTHAATHPRLGVVDHISLHPLGSLVRRSAASHHHHHHHTAPHPWPGHPEDHYYHNHHARQQQQRTSHPAGLHDSNQHQQQHPRQQQQQQQHHGAGGGGGPATVWQPPPPGLAGLAVAASCAQYIAWHLSQDDDEDGGATEAAAAAGGGGGRGGGGGPPAALRVMGRAEAVPVYLYGYAHPSRRCLSDVRRQLGYFRRAPDGGWGSGESPLPDPNDVLRYPPDMGPEEPPPQSGLVTIGAVPWVVNYNVPLQDVDLEEAKWLARAVSERGGGLAGVEAMALKHADESVEVACNLLDETVSSPHAVQARLEALASSRGLDQWAVLWGYRTNKSPEELLRAAAAGGATSVERRG